ETHVCCGRPLYDYGFLDLAKSYLRRTMETMRPEIEAGIPIVVLEPSCASVFRDELHGLFPNDSLANKLKEQTFLLSEFIQEKAKDWDPPKLESQALVQGHCHHKSLLRFDDENEVLRKVGLDYKLLASGCCGMAGSFGFEYDKYDVSVDIGERVLLPAVRKAGGETLIVADGFSCREQIAQETNRQALHLAEVIQIAQHPAMMISRGGCVESEIVKKRKNARGGGGGEYVAPQVTEETLRGTYGKGNWRNGVGHRGGIYPAGKSRAAAADDQSRDGLHAECFGSGGARGDYDLLQGSGAGGALPNYGSGAANAACAV